MNQTLLALVVAPLLLLSAHADTLVCYPDVDEPVFSFTIPDDSWDFAPSEGDDVDGGYCTLQRGNTILYFRTVECSEESIVDAIQETFDYIIEEYDEAEIADPSELTIQGYDALGSSGTGIDADGYEWVFGFAWIFIDAENIAEVWFESTTDEVGNQRAANRILNTFAIAR